MYGHQTPERERERYNIMKRDAILQCLVLRTNNCQLVMAELFVCALFVLEGVLPHTDPFMIMYPQCTLCPRRYEWPMKIRRSYGLRRDSMMLTQF